MKNYDRIYRLQSEDYGRLPPVIGDYVKDKVPEIEKVARLARAWGSITYTQADNPEASIQAPFHGIYSESTAFDVFTFPFTKGNPTTALDNPFTIVLTESIARNLFGDKNPMGETVEFYGDRLEVTGIIKDVKNSHIEIDGLLSIETIGKKTRILILPIQTGYGALPMY